MTDLILSNPFYYISAFYILMVGGVLFYALWTRDDPPTGDDSLWGGGRHLDGGTRPRRAGRERGLAILGANRRLTSAYRLRPRAGESARVHPSALRGTIQRIDYQRRELRVIAGGRVWEFVVPVNCRLWFNETPAVLRCFHPLDPVTVLYQDQAARHVAEVICSWEPRPTAGRE